MVSESQIRTVLQQFRDKVLPEAFPGRGEVPKTLIFAKDDSHADDIVRIAREVAERDADNAFTAERREWLDRMAEHIATSLAIEPEDFQTGWFGQRGSLGRTHLLFGNELTSLLSELNEKLAA